MNKIKLTYKATYIDGGTNLYIGSDGKSYYEDYRLQTKTKGALYNDYPDHSSAKILNWGDFEIVKKIKQIKKGRSKYLSNLLKHAERELKLIGYDGKDEYDNMAKEAILQLIETFAKQGHSGFSAPYVAKMFHKLANYEVLSPLTGNDDEWNDVSDISGEMLFQNNRDSRVFKGEKGAYFLDAIVWQENINGDINHFTNKDSRRYIKSFPFTPKTFYIKVDEERNVLDTEEYEKANEYYA